MKAKSSIDSFGTFLETMQRLEPSGGAVRRQAPVDLLSHLADSGPEPVTNLMASCGLGVVEFATTLKTLQDAGLVAVAAVAGGQEIVQLTPIGVQLASHKP